MTKLKQKLSNASCSAETMHIMEDTHNLKDDRLFKSEILGIFLSRLTYQAFIKILGPHRPNNYKIILKLEQKYRFLFKLPLIWHILKMEETKPKAYEGLCKQLQNLIQDNHQDSYLDDPPSYITLIDYDEFQVQFDKMNEEVLGFIHQASGIIGDRASVKEIIEYYICNDEYKTLVNSNIILMIATSDQHQLLNIKFSTDDQEQDMVKNPVLQNPVANNMASLQSRQEAHVQKMTPKNKK